MPNCISAVEQNSVCSGQLLKFMSVVSETIGTKSTNGLAVQYVHCERLGCSLIMITIVLMNAYMHAWVNTLTCPTWPGHIMF